MTGIATLSTSRPGVALWTWADDLTSQVLQ
jgi:hypothetical protein